jgi:hypothetical protein
VKERGQGRPDQKPTSQNNAYLKEQGKPSPGFPTPKPEQPPHGGGINKPEIHPPKEIPLALEPNLPDHDQQTANLDPEIEEMIRAASLGDPEEEKRLREECKESSSLREFFKNPGRFGSLTNPAPDFSKPREKQE